MLPAWGVKPACIAPLQLLAALFGPILGCLGDSSVAYCVGWAHRATAIPRHTAPLPCCCKQRVVSRASAFCMGGWPEASLVWALLLRVLHASQPVRRHAACVQQRSGWCYSQRLRGGGGGPLLVPCVPRLLFHLLPCQIALSAGLTAGLCSSQLPPAAAGRLITAPHDA